MLGCPGHLETGVRTVLGMELIFPRLYMSGDASVFKGPEDYPCLATSACFFLYKVNLCLLVERQF